MFFELLLQKKKHNIELLTREDVGIMKNMSFDAKILKTKTKKREKFSKFGQPCLERNTKQDFVEMFYGEGVI